MSFRHRSIAPAHPGELLREIVLPATGRTKAEVARLLRISRQHLYDVLGARKPVTPETAIRLGKLFGDGADIWWRMQAERDLWEARQTVDVSDVPTIKAA